MCSHFGKSYILTGIIYIQIKPMYVFITYILIFLVCLITPISQILVLLNFQFRTQNSI